MSPYRPVWKIKDCVQSVRRSSVPVGQAIVPVVSADHKPGTDIAMAGSVIRLPVHEIYDSACRQIYDLNFNNPFAGGPCLDYQVLAGLIHLYFIEARHVDVLIYAVLASAPRNVPGIVPVGILNRKSKSVVIARHAHLPQLAGRQVARKILDKRIRLAHDVVAVDLQSVVTEDYISV